MEQNSLSKIFWQTELKTLNYLWAALFYLLSFASVMSKGSKQTPAFLADEAPREPVRSAGSCSSVAV